MSRLDEEITAVVLTLGEPSFDRCIEALEAQSVQPAHRVVVGPEVRDGFHAAFNHGVSLVETEYVLQLDGDMLMDPDCVQILKGGMEANTGVSLGLLEDPLLGNIQGIKLFRTEVFRQKPFPPTLTTDTDRIRDFGQEGYEIALVQRSKPAYGHSPDVLGHHQPPYEDPIVLFGRFFRLGKKARARQSYQEFAGILARLRRSAHPGAEMAIVALVQGVMSDEPAGVHGALTRRTELDRLLAFQALESPTAKDRATTWVKRTVDG